MTQGRTVLIMKDPEKGNSPSNYRPITCLPVMWKMLTGIISREMYSFLENEGLLPEEQKGCRKGSRGTNDQLYIDERDLEKVKHAKRTWPWGGSTTKKAFDMIPHLWILECLELFGVAENIQVLLANTIKSWRTELTSNGQKLGEVNITKLIFQGDFLSLLLFVTALIPLSLIFRKATADISL